jgi:hypothetical protein
VREAIDATSSANECKSAAASHQREEAAAGATQASSIGERMHEVREEDEGAGAKPVGILNRDNVKLRRKRLGGGKREG